MVINEVSRLAIIAVEGRLEAGDALAPPPGVTVGTSDEEALFLNLDWDGVVCFLELVETLNLDKRTEFRVLILDKDGAIVHEPDARLGSTD